MKNIVKSWLALGAISYANVSVFATDIFGTKPVAISGSADSAETAVQTLLSQFLSFLYLIAVIYAIWGGFNILTAGGDEEKVKKGKTILIQAILGLIVIFLASSIITWVIESLLV